MYVLCFFLLRGRNGNYPKIIRVIPSYLETSFMGSSSIFVWLTASRSKICITFPVSSLLALLVHPFVKFSGSALLALGAFVSCNSRSLQGKVQQIRVQESLPFVKLAKNQVGVPNYVTFKSYLMEEVHEEELSCPATVLAFLISLSLSIRIKGTVLENVIRFL